MLATGRNAAIAQIDPPYSPSGASVHLHLTRHSSGPFESAPNGISIGSSGSVGLAVMTNTETDRPVYANRCIGMGRVSATHAGSGL